MKRKPFPKLVVFISVFVFFFIGTKLRGLVDGQEPFCVDFIRSCINGEPVPWIREFFATGVMLISSIFLTYLIWRKYKENQQNDSVNETE